MSHRHYVSKDREGAGEGHPGAPCCAGHWENTEHKRSPSSESKLEKCRMLGPRGSAWEGVLPCKAVREEEKSGTTTEEGLC